MLSAPIGPAPNTITLSPGVTFERVMPCMATESGSARAAWRGARPSGSRSTPAARATMYSAKAPSVCSVVIEWRFSHCDGLPSWQRRHVPQRGDAPPTTNSPTDQWVTLSPIAAMVPLHSCPATTPWRQAPAVAQLVDVGAADATRVDADDDLVGAGLGDGPLFDGHDAWGLVHGRRHDVGK